MKYDDSFYATSRQGMISSAEALVPILLSELGLDASMKLIDVGCGEGWWANTFAEYGLEVLGIDGEWHGPDHPLGRRFITQDLSVSLDHPSMHRQFDVVVCLEVAEHLPERRAASFVSDLCKLSSGGPIIFSAAIPGQGGTGHVNEAWPDYWAELFAIHGRRCDGHFRLQIWSDPRIENWYRQNLLIFEVDEPGPPPLRLVHPVLYDARRPR